MSRILYGLWESGEHERERGKEIWGWAVDGDEKTRNTMRDENEGGGGGEGEYRQKVGCGMLIEDEI